MKKNNPDSKESNFKNIKDFFKSYKDISSIGSANIFAAIVSGIFWLYLASSLGTEEYGRISYLIAAATISFSISHFGAKTTVTVFTAKEGKRQPSLFFVSIISSIAASIVIFFIFEQIGVSLFVIGLAIFSLATHDLLGRKLYKKFSIDTITQRILLVGLALGFYFLLGPEGILLGFGLSYFPFVFRLVSGFTDGKIELSIIKKRFNFIIHSYAEHLSQVFVHNFEKLIILPLFGYVLLGNYQLGIQFILLFSIMPQSIYQYILPKDSTGESNPKLKKIAVLVSIAFAALTIVFAPIFISYLFPEFKEAPTVIQIMGLAIIPITINFMYKSKFFGSGQSKLVFIGSGIYISAQIIGILVLGNIYGIYGAAAALVLGASLQSLFYFSSDIINKK